MARKKRTPRGIKPNQPPTTDAKTTGGPHTTKNTKQVTSTNTQAGSSKKSKKRQRNANLRSIHKQKDKKDKKDAKHFTKFIGNLMKPGEPGPRSRPTSLTSSDLSRPRPKALRAFTQLVNTVQEVAVVDVRPGLQVDFAKLPDSRKKSCHYMHVERRMRFRKNRINRVMESNCLPPVAREKSPNPDDNMRDPSNEDVFIVDMPARQKQGNSEVCGTNQLENTKPRVTEQSPTSKQSTSTVHQLPVGSFKQKTRSSPKKPNHQDAHASTSSVGNHNIVTSQSSNGTPIHQQPHPSGLQSLGDQHKELVSADSGGVSSSKSEIESNISETEYTSAESDAELETSMRTPGVQEMDEEEEIQGVTYDWKRANILPNTYPTCSVALIHPLSYLPFLGQVKMSVLHGKVKVHGYIIDVDSDPVAMYSSQSAPALRIETSDEMFKLEKENETAIQELKQRLSSSFMTDDVDSVIQDIHEYGASVIRLEQLWSDRTAYVTNCPFYKDLFRSDRKWGRSKGHQRVLNTAAKIGFYPIKPGLGFKIITAPSIYDEATDPILDYLDQGKKPTVMICGWKNVGKSTFARYLINSMLNKTDAICYLDCDVGQTEFNPPSLMGITKVTKPLLGPPFTNNKEPDRMCFYGDINPGSSPSTYCEAVKQLLQYYTNNFQDLPLVVNCYGWMKGLGLSILVDSIHAIQPSHILQLLPTPRPKSPPILNKEYLQTARGWSRVEPETRPDWDLCHMLLQMPWKTDEGRRYKAQHHRELSLTAYMSHLMPTNFKFDNPFGTFEPLKALQPYSVPWRSVGVHICNADVPVTQLMYALNASIVGLCTADTSQMIPIDGNDSDNLPKVFQSTPVCQCHGLGIIRGIDPVHKMFYILTHLPHSILDQVNTILKGAVSLPQFLIQQDEKCEVPYVTSEFPHDVTGTSSIKVLHMTPKYRHRRDKE